jgi:hypothetical protein
MFAAGTWGRFATCQLQKPHDEHSLGDREYLQQVQNLLHNSYLRYCR